MTKEETLSQLGKVESIALRSETFDGINDSLIINDTYSMDLDAFRSSLEYQFALAKNRRRIVIIDEKVDQAQIEVILDQYQPIDVYYVNAEAPVVESCKDAVVLIKGMRSSAMEKHAAQYRVKKHQTTLEINLDGIRRNIETFKNKLDSATKILVMVKASSYGSGGVRMAKFLERIGVNYLGVAYADEGVELREAGVTLPILVMNCEESGFDDCIKNDLEPAIYDNVQLEQFIKALIYQNKVNYPIHIKLETGMKRLGFDREMLPALIQKLATQPEIKIESIYSHLADADNPSSSFVHQQFDTYLSLAGEIEKHLSYPVVHHLLNSEGCANFPQFQLDMVRLGIGIYGYSANPGMKKQLEPVVAWNSSISQLKKVKPGESVGYSRKAIAEKQMTIAVIPVGYADGLRRSISNGNGGVFIDNKFCPIVGNVCMDMIMVDVTGLAVSQGQKVEIIGSHQTIEDLAKAYDTIPYEVLTGISKRVHRTYIEN
jgi:alanine racemase